MTAKIKRHMVVTQRNQMPGDVTRESQKLTSMCDCCASHMACFSRSVWDRTSYLLSASLSCFSFSDNFTSTDTGTRFFGTQDKNRQFHLQLMPWLNDQGSQLSLIWHVNDSLRNLAIKRTETFENWPPKKTVQQHSIIWTYKYLQ